MLDFTSCQQPLSSGCRVLVQMAELQLAPTQQGQVLCTIFSLSRGRPNDSSAYRVSQGVCLWSVVTIRSHSAEGLSLRRKLPGPQGQGGPWTAEFQWQG